MNFIYVLINGYEWEDFVVLLSEEEAINESINYPNSRVEIFGRNEKGGYVPTYNRYENGKLIQTL